MLTSLTILIISLWYIHDKYIQRKHQILTNYPIIGRLRFLFEELREPFRQYFGDEKFYESKDKLDWVYKASHDLPNFASFSPSQPLPKPKFLIKHSSFVLNDSEIKDDFSVTFGANCKIPFVSKSIISRAAMSDGAISPEATRAFAWASFEGGFPINTGEGGLTSNFLASHRNYHSSYMTIYKGSKKQKRIRKLIESISNSNIATKMYMKLVLKNNPEIETFLYNGNNDEIYRVNWNAPIDAFPKNVPIDLPDIIFQISSGLYGVRDLDGNFDPIKYQKVMSFCKMTEIKIAQGAKQTGGKLVASKVTEAIAYYRGVRVNEDLFSPNRFPYANNPEELFDFIGKLKKLSKKPVGIKIVISDYNNILPFVLELKKRIKNNCNSYPDFFTIDGGRGGSATAPIELMERVGLNIKHSVYLVNKVLEEYKLRDKVKIVASGKLLTPDDLIIIMSLGADFVQIARGFMMSAGCIRARYCSGTSKHTCPVGLATQDKSRRRKYFIHKHAVYIRNYHANLLKNLKTILAIMGIKSISELDKNKLLFLDKDSKVHDNIDEVLHQMLDLKEVM